MRNLLGFLIVVGYSIAYLTVALTDDVTSWWWWFVPIYGTIQIFQESVGLGVFHVAILPVVFIVSAMMEA